MAEHVVDAGGAELFNFRGVPVVYFFERMGVPFGFDLGSVVAPAVQEMHRADQVVEFVGREDLADGFLVLKVAYFHADLHSVTEFSELGDEVEVIIDGVFEFIRLEPCLLKFADEGIVEDQVLVVEVFEFGKGVAVLGDAYFVEAAFFGGIEKALDPVFIVRAVFKVHMVIQFHNLGIFFLFSIICLWVICCRL